MSKELIIKDFKSKLKDAREFCPGMSDEIYEICNYMSNIANDTVKPETIALLIVCILDDISKKKSGFPKATLPDYLIVHGNQCIAQMQYFPQVIDEIANEEFAESFREICEDKLKMYCPKRIRVSQENNYPENIEVAVNWWANAIQSPKMDNGTDIFAIFSVMLANKEYTQEEISEFKEILANNIEKEMKKNRRCTLDVDYGPCELLQEAGNKIGISDFGYPIKTHMLITDDQVIVSEGYKAPNKTIWSKERIEYKIKTKEK